MAQIPDKINRTINRYLAALKENAIPIKEAVLFGSYATGKYQSWSDIDIALVSDIFSGNRITDKDKIRPITLSISSELEILPFAPHDFTPSNPFAKEIMSTGVKLI